MWTHLKAYNSETKLDIKKMNVLVVTLLSLYSLSKLTTANDSPIVTTTHGKIQGVGKIVNTQNILQFLKVPYAKPPIGSLRFQKPESPDPWTDIYDASEYGPACRQPSLKKYSNTLPNVKTSEDCLYMNIYIPHTMDDTNLKAVMVYIHGGGYYTKTANLYDGSLLALSGNVVVILINYRLGMFGFLSTGDENAKGNYGLWDQIQALRWIKNNIRNFGGDANRITVFGHSAGGYSIGLLTLSAYSKGLFQRAILMSGFGISERAITHGALSTTLRIGEKLGCGPNLTTDTIKPNTASLVECFKRKTATEIRKATSAMRSEDAKYPQFIMRPGPVIDGELLTGNPTKLITNLNSPLYSLDFMAGTSYSDGWLLKSKLISLGSKFNFSLELGVPTRVMCDGIIPILASDYYESNKTFDDNVCSFYARKSSFIEQGLEIVNMYGDMMYAAPAVKSLRMHSKYSNNRKAYHFLFSHKPSFPVYNSRVSWLRGAQHGDQCWFIFRNSQFHYTSGEIKLNDVFMKYLTNFAKHGDPNGNLTDRPWPAYDTVSEFYMDFNITPTIHKHLFRDRMEFWLKTLPSRLNENDTPNRSHSIYTNGSIAMKIHLVIWTFILSVM